MYATAIKKVSVGGKAKVIGGGEASIPETVKLKLELEVEAAYQQSMESIQSRLDSVVMAAAPGTHIVYTIVWEELTYRSFVQYALGDKVYEVPYVYSVTVPKIDKSYQVSCSDSEMPNTSVEKGKTNPTPTKITSSTSEYTNATENNIVEVNDASQCPLIVREGTVGGLPIESTITWQELSQQGTTREPKSSDINKTCSRTSDNKVQVFVGYWDKDTRYLEFRGAMSPQAAIELAKSNPGQPVIIVPWGG